MNVLLIHGLIGSFAQPDISRMIEAEECIALDLLGYGPNRDVNPARVTIADQVAHVAKHLGADTQVTLVGHSVGGVVAMLVAAQYPRQTRCVINVEGNFTLRDAFWTNRIAKMALPDIEALLEQYLSAPETWLSQSGIPLNGENVKIARFYLENQPASTLQAMARSVVDVTERPEYSQALQSVFDRTPVHLIAGERSREGWDVQEWALRKAASFQTVCGAGHMMMVEDPRAFCRAINAALTACRNERNRVRTTQ